jgi:signal peptidase I
MAIKFLSKLERGFIWFFDLGQLVILVAIVVVVFYYTLGQFFVVRGVSMDPNLSEGQWLVVSKINHYLHLPQRGEIVVFHFPGTQRDKYIKRIVGLPGEKVAIKGGKVSINGQLLHESYLPQKKKIAGQVNMELEKGEYFVLGDNRDQSNDSRAWGPLPRDRIIGQAVYLLYPFADRELITVPGYHLSFSVSGVKVVRR